MGRREKFTDEIMPLIIRKKTTLITSVFAGLCALAGLALMLCLAGKHRLCMQLLSVAVIGGLVWLYLLNKWIYRAVYKISAKLTHDTAKLDNDMTETNEFVAGLWL